MTIDCGLSGGFLFVFFFFFRFGGWLGLDDLDNENNDMLRS